MTEITPESTVAEAVAYVHEGKQGKGGVICPCCDQRVKVYRRPFTKYMARMLLALESFKTDDFIHVNELHPRGIALGNSHGSGGDYGKMAAWGLVEAMSQTSARNKKTVGYWKITDKGRSFVHGHTSIPSHAYFFNAQSLGFDQDQVTMQDVLNDGAFSYEKLMEAASPPVSA